MNATTSPLPDPRLCRMVLHAWVGEDENGSGIYGIKQGITPCGLIPLVASLPGRLDGPHLRPQLVAQHQCCGKTLYLARFVFDAVEQQIPP